MQLKNAVEIGDFCRSDYIYWPLSSNKKLVFDEVIRRVKGGDVLDLGCGEAGLYWALGDTDKTDSVSFLDINEGHVQSISEQIEKISPDYLNENFGTTIDWLKEKSIVSHRDITDLATDLIEKIDDVSVFDFQKQNPSKTYDTALCIESLQVADNQETLNSQVVNVSRFIRENGSLIGISWVYNEFNDHTQGLVNLKYDGLLNPDQDAFKKAFEYAGLQIIELKTVQTPDINNYHKAVVFHVTKAG